MNKKLIIFTAFSILSFSAFAEDAVRDPFKPFSWEKPKVVTSVEQNENYDVTPLTEKALSYYRVIGTIVSPSDALTLIRSREKGDFFANVGDSIGNEGGKISLISSDGITVDMNGKIINLTVSSRLDAANEIE